MTSTFTSNKGLEKPGNGDYVDTWNIPVNGDMDVIDQAFGGATNLNATSGSATLTDTQYRSLSLNITGAITGNVTYTIPAGVGGQWIVFNQTTGNFDVIFTVSGSSSPITLLRSKINYIYSDGVNMRAVTNQITGVAQGGTGAATLAANNVLLGNGTSAVQTVAPGTNGNVLTSNGTTWVSQPVSSVTAVSTISFGSTGFTPSTATSGAVTVAGTLNITNGGTGATSASQARTSLGAATSGANSDITSLSGLTTALSIPQGGTGAQNAADARTNLDVPSRSGSGATGTWGINISGNAGTVTNGITTGNIGSYAPSLTGTGASGTWNINISGNAASVTNGITTGNIGSYAPSLTGTGASGTWSININGSAATATSATNATNATNASNATGTLASQVAKAWVNFDGTSGTINKAFNVSSITVNGTGDFTINFSSSIADANFAISGSCAVGGNLASIVSLVSTSTSSVRIVTSNQGGQKFNPTIVTVMIFD